MNEARADGTICELLFNDMKGDFRDDFQYFLDADGKWYCLDEKAGVFPQYPVINWRPAWVKLTPERRNLIKRRNKSR